MSPLSLPVLAGAAVVSSPSLWGALVEGTTTTQAALTRYLVSVAICWVVLAFVDLLVGPAPKADTEEPSEEGAGEGAESAGGEEQHPEGIGVS